MGRATEAGAFRVRFVAVLTIAYVVFVLAVTLYPHAVDRDLDVPIQRLLTKLQDHGLPAFVDYSVVEFGANVLFFVPVGFLGGLLFTFRLAWLGAVLGFVLSAGVETAQGALLPGRVASLNDVLANTSGAMAGMVAAVLVRLTIHHRDRLVVHDVAAGRRAESGLRTNREKVTRAPGRG